MRVGAIGTAAVILGIWAPAAEAAVTYTVQPGGGPCSSSTDQNCENIGTANGAAQNGDVIQITPGSWSGGVTFAQNGLTVRGIGIGTGEARVNGALTFTGSGAIRVERLAVLAATDPALTFSTGLLASGKTVEVGSSILSGAGANPAIRAVVDSGALGGITLNARHVTIADSASAPAVELDNATATFHDSIVKGTATGATLSDNNETAAANASLFVDPAGENFHLRAAPSNPALGTGDAADGGETTTDVDGTLRQSTPWDKGADEFTNLPPSATIGIFGTNSATPNQALDFGAGATDPNSGAGDVFTLYRWRFGDGSPVLETTGSGVSHAYAAPGTYQAQVSVVDAFGVESPLSPALAITVQAAPSGGSPTGGVPGGLGPGTGAGTGVAGDVAAPFLVITSPRRAQSVRYGRIVPMFHGRTSDPSGVRRVELALLRRSGRTCRWYDGRAAFRIAPCSRPRWFRALVDDFAWRYAFPRAVRPLPGAYTLLARATDVRGNTTARLSAAARTSISFSYRR